MFSEENIWVGVAWAAVLLNWQHEVFMLMPGVLQSPVIPQQQLRCVAGPDPGKQASAGVAAHKATITNSNNAPFLLQFIKPQSYPDYQYPRADSIRTVI
jgi:hypothetical protein